MAPVVKLGRAERGMIGHLLRMFERPVVGELIGNAGSPQRVISDNRLGRYLFDGTRSRSKSVHH